MTKPTRATPESGSTPLSSRVDPILTPAKAEREAAANRSVDTSDTLKQTVTKATPSVSDETLALFGRRNDFATRYHLTRRGKIKRLGQITRIVEQFDVLHGLTPVKMRLMFESLGTMTELKTVARMLTRGQLRVNMELVGSEEPFQLLS